MHVCLTQRKPLEHGFSATISWPYCKINEDQQTKKENLMQNTSTQLFSQKIDPNQKENGWYWYQPPHLHAFRDAAADDWRCM